MIVKRYICANCGSKIHTKSDFDVLYGCKYGCPYDEEILNERPFHVQTVKITEDFVSQEFFDVGEFKGNVR